MKKLKSNNLMQYKLSPLKPLAGFFMPRILPPTLHNAVVFELRGGLADQIRIICFAKWLHDSWQGEKPEIIFNIWRTLGSYGIGTTPVAYDDPELQTLLKSRKRSYDASGKKLASQAFELCGYDMDWSWTKGFITMSRKMITRYELFGRRYKIYRASKFIEIISKRKIKLPSYIRSFPDFEMFESPIAAGFLKSLTAKMKEDNRFKLAEIKETQNSICVHIRRGDYIAHYDGLSLPAEYFEKAIAKIITQTRWESVTLFVFSDDWEWAEQAINFSFSGVDLKIDFVRLNDISEPIPELELMRSCKHFVISAGNFARMAAEMAINEEKIMIMPIRSNFVKE